MVIHGAAGRPCPRKHDDRTAKHRDTNILVYLDDFFYFLGLCDVLMCSGATSNSHRLTVLSLLYALAPAYC